MRYQDSGQAARRRVAVLLVPGVLTAGIVAAQLAPSAPPLRGPASPQPPAQDGKLLERARRAAAIMGELERSLPRDAFDPSTVIEQVGREPQALLGWVRDQTSSVPYRGCLRGPRGVMMDRLGNSLDRALLLADLVRSSGGDVRLARASLSPEQAKQIFVPPRPPAASPAAGEQVDPGQLDAYARRHHLDLAALQKALKDVADQKAKVEVEARMRIASQTALLKKAVSAEPAATPGESEGAVDHWWVQRQEGGKWIDLDPDRAESAPALTPAATVALAVKSPVASLPADLCHEMTIRVIVEQDAQGTLKEATALERTIRPADVMDRQISIRHVPLNGPALPDPARQPDAAARLKAAALGHTEWMPILMIGHENVSHFSVKQSGELNDRPRLSGAAQVGGEVQRGFGGFGAGLAGGDGNPESSSAGVFSAEWIEYELRAPGQPARKLRQVVFDLVGPAARAAASKDPPKLSEAQRLDRSLTLLGEVSILPLVCRLPSQYVEYGLVHAIAHNARAVSSLASGGDVLQRPDLPEKMDALLEPLPGPLSAFALGRASWRQGPEAVFVNQITLVTLITRPVYSGDEKLAMRQTLDLVSNELAARPGAGIDAFAARLEQGVIDTVAESMALSDPVAPPSPDEAASNTSTFFASAGGGGLVVLRSAGDAALTTLQVSPDVRARIARSLDDGYAIVLPAAAGRGGRIAWYRVNPRTGDTIGVADTGYHQENTERTQMEAMIQRVFGNPRIRLEHVAEAGDMDIYNWMVMRGGGGPDLLRLCIQLRNGVCQALAMGI